MTDFFEALGNIIGIVIVAGGALVLLLLTIWLALYLIKEIINTVEDFKKR
jgi:hypothetical protein